MKHAHATLVVLSLSLLGCRAPEPTEAAWLRSWSADWANFNHRLAYLSLRPTADGVDAAFIGGASTTGIVFDEACIDPTTCAEFPVADVGLLTADVVRATSEEVVLATGTVTLDVGADGATAPLSVSLPRGVEGDAVAWIGGFTFDTTAPLPSDAASCYDARYGWMPRHLRMAVGAATIGDGGEAVDVDVEAAFDAGLSFEDVRACLDAVEADAHALVTLDVVVAAGAIDAATFDVTDAASWPERSDDQDITDLGDTTVAFGGAGPVGWSALDFAFHEVVEPGRGAYLRTLQVEADPDGDVAFGWASNTSLTQLSGFDYAFAGTALQLEGVSAGTVVAYADDALPAELDASGAPVIHALPVAP